MASGNICTVLGKTFWISKGLLNVKESKNDCRNKKGVLAEIIEPDMLKEVLKRCIKPKQFNCDEYRKMTQYRFNLQPCIQDNKVVVESAYLRNQCEQHKFKSFKIKDSVNISNVCEFVVYANGNATCENAKIRPTMCNVKRNYICQIPHSYEGSSYHSSSTEVYEKTTPFIKNNQKFSSGIIIGIIIVIVVLVVLLFLILLVRRKRLYKNCNVGLSLSKFTNTFRSLFLFNGQLKMKGSKKKKSKLSNSRNIISSISIEETYVK